MDFFRFAAPPAPRDRLRVSLQNPSTTFMPYLKLYNSSKEDTKTEAAAATAGADLTMQFSAEPGALYYLMVGGSYGSAGDYSFSVKE